MNNIENNLKRLQAAIRLLGINDHYYLLSSGRYEVNIQAEYNSEFVVKLKENKFIFIGIGKNGYIEFKRNNIIITLT